MRASVFILLLTVLPSFALGAQKPKAPAGNFSFTKKINPDVFQSQLISAGFNVDHISCSGDHCWIAWGSGGEKKDPTPIITAHVYADPIVEDKKDREQISLLGAKLKAGTITPQEKDQILLLMLKVLFSVK